MILSFPAPPEEMLKIFGDEAELAQQGMTLISREAIQINQQPGILAQIEQDAHGLTFRKWVLIFGQNSKTTMHNS